MGNGQPCLLTSTCHIWWLSMLIFFVILVRRKTSTTEQVQELLVGTRAVHRPSRRVSWRRSVICCLVCGFNFPLCPLARSSPLVSFFSLPSFLPTSVSSLPSLPDLCLSSLQTSSPALSPRGLKTLSQFSFTNQSFYTTKFLCNLHLYSPLLLDNNMCFKNNVYTSTCLQNTTLAAQS